jgi:hypothetical protein
MLSGDPSINGIVDHIFGKRLPLEDSGETVDEKTDTILLFDYHKEGSEGTRDAADYLADWIIYVYTSSPNVESLFNLNDRIQEYLESYSTDKVLVVQFQGDNQNYDSELDIYYNDSEYRVLYSS